MPRWMEIAWADVGTREIAGAEANETIVGYFREVGRGDITSDEVAWCGGYAGSCLSRAGISLAAIPNAERLLARAYLRIGTPLPLDQPRVGALAIFKRHDGPPGSGHVNFVTGWTATHIVGLGGNQANSVNVASYPRSDLIGLRWPAEPATLKELATESRIAAAAQRQVRDGAKATSSGGTIPVVPAPAARPKLPDVDVLAEKAQGFKGLIETLEMFAAFVGGKWPWIAGGLAAYWAARMVYDGWIIGQARLEDHNTGATPHQLEE